MWIASSRTGRTVGYRIGKPSTSIILGKIFERLYHQMQNIKVNTKIPIKTNQAPHLHHDPPFVAAALLAILSYAAPTFQQSSVIERDLTFEQKQKLALGIGVAFGHPLLGLCWCGYTCSSGNYWRLSHYDLRLGANFKKITDSNAPLCISRSCHCYGLFGYFTRATS